MFPLSLLRAFATLGLLLCVSACETSVERPGKPHHTAYGFRNIYPYDPPTRLDFLRWQWERVGKKTTLAESAKKHLPGPTETGWLRHNKSDTSATWIGHATVFLQIEGKNILTDPHFTERASPVSWAGPKRLLPPGIPLASLPPIDAVVISHDHYDSLDTGTIIALRERRGGDNTVFFVPLGLREWLQDLGIRNVVELDWWDTVQWIGLQISAVPAQHWSKRHLIGRNRTLWAGWVISSANFRFYFAGDSGYAPHFREIGERFGPFDLAAIPIGAYEPRWFMKAHHLSPEEAVQAHLDVRAAKSLAIHWGTFILTDEPPDEPPARLAEALRAASVQPDDFRVLGHGETWRLD